MTNSRVIKRSVLHRQRTVQAVLDPDRGQRLRAGATAGQPGRRVGAGGGEEDQEHQHADAEQHRDRLQHPTDHPRGAGVRRASASRLSSSTVTTTASPGAIATAGPAVDQPLPVRDQRAPAGTRRLHAHAEHGQRRFRQQVERHHRRREQQQRRRGVRHDVAAHHVRPRCRRGRPPPARTPPRAATAPGRGPAGRRRGRTRRRGWRSSAPGCPPSSVSGPRCRPELASTAESEMASRNTGNAQSRSSSQRSTPSTTPPSAPASTPTSRPARA